MDSTRLASFYKNMATWPAAEPELGLAAEKVRRFLDVPAAAVWVPSLGFRAAGTSVNPDDLLRQVKIQLEQPDFIGEPVMLKPDGSQFAAIEAVPLRESQPAGGWLIAASNRPLSDDQRAGLLVAAQRLGALADGAASRTDLATRDQFLSIASHELKTPLTSIYGILQLQERMLRPKKDVSQTPEQERQHSFFKIVIRQVERLNELIDGLLDVSRIHNGRFMVEPSESDVASIVTDTVNTRLNVIAKDAGVKIQVDAPAHLSAFVDPIRFEEVITNLGMNAIRFSPEGGMVWIKLRDQGGAVVLSIRDQGPAIPEADRSRIFQPFERAQRTARLGGLGLGLFISRQIAQLHGGDVALVESIAGKGNLMEARFPIHRAERASA